MLRRWENLPKCMQTEEVRPYYNILKRKKVSLALKRGFDFLMASFMLIILFPILVLISILISIDSKGGVFFRQERITQYGKKFKIFKFRTMIANADKIGAQVTIQNDSRITKVGSVLRRYRLDELPQLINILSGDMTFVGTRPESPLYVEAYTPEMFATLLQPAGVTSETSIRFKDEAELLEKAENVDEVYIEKILPQKMKYNLESVKNFSVLNEIKTMIKTVIAVMR